MSILWITRYDFYNSLLVSVGFSRFTLAGPVLFDDGVAVGHTIMYASPAGIWLDVGPMGFN